MILPLILAMFQTVIPQDNSKDTTHKTQHQYTVMLSKDKTWCGLAYETKDGHYRFANEKVHSQLLDTKADAVAWGKNYCPVEGKSSKE